MMARKRRPLPDFLAYLPVACLARVAGWLPYRSRLALGAAVGRGAVRLPRYRRRIAANLAHVLFQTRLIHRWVDDVTALAAGTGQHQNLIAFCGIARGGCSPLGRLIVRVRVDS